MEVNDISRAWVESQLSDPVIGWVSVDSGTMKIADPCHKNRDDLACLLDNFGGDGTYPVTATRYDMPDQLKTLTIHFELQTGDAPWHLSGVDEDTAYEQAVKWWRECTG